MDMKSLDRGRACQRRPTVPAVTAVGRPAVGQDAEQLQLGHSPDPDYIPVSTGTCPMAESPLPQHICSRLRATQLNLLFVDTSKSQEMPC